MTPSTEQQVAGKISLTRFQWLFLIWALCHLGLTLYHAQPFFFSGEPSNRQVVLDCLPLRLYAEYSGADKHYGFFAPGVAPDVRIRFIILGPGGSPHTELFELPEANNEVGHRLYTLRSVFAKAESFQDYGTLSLAAAVFSANPGAKQVTVCVDVQQTPSMAEFCQGKQPHWVQIYQGVFAKE